MNMKRGIFCYKGQNKLILIDENTPFQFFLNTLRTKFNIPKKTNFKLIHSKFKAEIDDTVLIKMKT